MRLLLMLMFTAIGGFFAHLTRPILIREFTNGGKIWGGWFAVAVPAVGVLLNIPFSVAIHEQLGRVDSRERHLCAYLLSFLAFGAGTTFGHWMVPDRYHNRGGRR